MLNVDVCCVLRSMQVTKAKIHVEQKPWMRVQQNGRPHDHGGSSGSSQQRIAASVCSGPRLLSARGLDL